MANRSPLAKSPRAYRGKYPTRIAEVSTLLGRPGVVYVRTNDGRAFESRACAMSGQLPKVGQDVADWAGFRPFRLAMSRTLAALTRIDMGLDQTVPCDGLSGREVAAACIAAARRCLGSPSIRGRGRAAIYAYAATCTLQLARDHSGGQDWAEVAGAAYALLSARVMPAHRRAESRALRAKHAGTPLLAAFRAHRAHKLSARDLTARTASAALSFARQDVARGWTRGPSRAGLLGHGDVLRTRTPAGRRVTFAIAHIPDDSMGAPWVEHDGHGVIRELDCPTYRHATKEPGERLFHSDARGATYYAYDIPATMAKARAEGWGLAPDDLAEFAAKLGRKPTVRQVTAEAVRRDFERCRGWVRDGWNWQGVALIEMPRGPHSPMPSHVANAAASGSDSRYPIAASLWGIESDSDPEYFDEMARELLSEAAASCN